MDWSNYGTTRLALLALLLASAGCTAVTNPVADGIPVRLVPQELLAPPKAGSQTIPLCALGQPQPDTYRLDAGDVLGVYIDGFVGDRNMPLPVHVAPLVQVPDQQRLAPGSGYPIPVQEDGTIILPSVPRLPVRGLTVGEARDAIRNLYLKKELIRPDNERILVTLLHPRHTEVLVFRQEAQAFQAVPDGPVPISKRNIGRVVDLPAYQNDVLHALVRSGGLPELDAYNEVIIYRDGCRDPQCRLDVLKQFEMARPGGDLGALVAGSGPIVRIPLRAPHGAPVACSPADVVLRTGDIVFLEARDEEVFFTGGLLPPGKHMLPRDQDLDVIQAIAQTHGSLYNGAFAVSNLSGLLINPGIGNPSPSLLVVLRRAPNRAQVPIVVDLREAMRHPQERLLIRPGDVLVLQEKPAEALVRYFTQTLFNFDVFWTPFRSRNATGVFDIAAPDRLPSRVGTVTNIN
jgi:hypothetical protein